MKTLIVGAGPAGLTLAGRLAQQGRPATIVERSTAVADGYAIGLYPIGSCVLHGLGLYEDFLARGLVLDRYELADAHGRRLQQVDMSRLTGAVGPLVCVSRRELVELLERGCDAASIRRGVTVVSCRRRDDAVHVELSDGTEERFDVVVACDGIDSATRTLVFGPQRGFDSGWALWTWWADRRHFPEAAAKEWWGTGWFFGAYPARDVVMCAAGAPAADVAVGGAARGDAVATVLRSLVGPAAGVLPGVAGAIDEIGDAYLWPMRDVRSRAWVDGRVALCGDAAAAFLPTAGVGASNAMRAAAALGDELSRAGAESVSFALERYEQRCRSIVERNQSESRRLARVMFVRRPGVSWVRDRVARLYPAERALHDIVKSARAPF